LVSRTGRGDPDLEKEMFDFMQQDRLVLRGIWSFKKTIDTALFQDQCFLMKVQKIGAIKNMIFIFD